MYQYSRIIRCIAVSSLLAVFSAHAYDKDGDYAPRHKKEHAPQYKRFTLTGGATYLVPSLNGLDYLAVETTTHVSSTASRHVETYNINPGYDWGYFLAAGYMISDRYDIQASWSQYNSASSDAESVVGDATVLTGTMDRIFVGADESLEAHTDETLKVQAFDANLGQYHKLTSMLTARPFVGVRYAKVDSNTSNLYVPSAASTQGESYESSFSGWGPEVGMDAEYEVYQKLGVVGHFAAAFLIGDQSTELELSESGAETVSINTGDDTRMVPTIDAKLGLNWNSLYANNSFGVGIEGGYQVAYYFNAVDQVQLVNGSFAKTMAPASNEIEHNYASVGVMGPYLNLSARF